MHHELVRPWQTASNPVGDTREALNAFLFWTIQRFEPPGKCGSYTKWRFHGYTLSPFSLSPPPDPHSPAFVEGKTVNGQFGFVISGKTSDIDGGNFTSVLGFRVTALNPGFNVYGATSTFSFIGELGPSASLTIQSDFFADADRKLLTGIGTGLSSTDSLILSRMYNNSSFG